MGGGPNRPTMLARWNRFWYLPVLGSRPSNKGFVLEYVPDLEKKVSSWFFYFFFVDEG